MKLKNKIISIVSAVSMLATMCFVAPVNAAGESFKVNVKSVDDKSITVSYLVSGVEKLSSATMKVQFDTDAIDTNKDNVTVDCKIGSNAPEYNFDAANKTFSMSVASATDTDLTEEGVVANVTFALKSAIVAPVNFTILKGEFENNAGGFFSYAPGAKDNNIDVPAEAAKAYPVISKDVLDAATIDVDTLYVGKESIAKIKGIDTAALADRKITVDPVNAKVDVIDATSVKITPEAEGDVKVTLSVDNNGTVVTSKEFTLGKATVKPEPTAYTVTATAVNTANGTTVTVKPDAEYTGTREAFDIVAQFYTEDGTAAGWVKVSDIAALNSGEYSVNLNAQNAAKVSVTVYKADTNTVIGKN